MWQQLVLLLTLLSAATMTGGQPLTSKVKICKTLYLTSGDYHLHRNVTKLHMEFVAKISGCQYIHGDVIFQGLGANPVSEDPLEGDIRMLNTDFLDSIVEITGKLQIRQTNLESITFRNLRAIRGYNPEKVDPFYAIEVIQSRYPTQLRLPRLSAILQGNVRITGNLNADLYCFLSRRIDWPSLFQSPEQRFLDDVRTMTWGDKQIDVSGYREVEAICSTSLPKCNTSCYTEKEGRQLCWSSGPEGCQSYHRCSTRICLHGNCFRNPYTGDEECCHTDCLGGCISERPDGCFSCREVSLEGSCRGSCPTKDWYNPGTQQKEVLNSSMVRAGNICVKKCEMPLVSSSDGQYCLSQCPATEIPFNGVCTACAAKNQAQCVECTVGTLKMTDARAQELRNANCTVWKTDTSLDVDASILKNNDSLATLELMQIFYGRLFIKRTETLVKDLRFLRNLRFVSDNFALMMIKTQYIGLANLRFAKVLGFVGVSGLCPAWYPRKRLQELSKTFSVLEKDVTFDNSSAECQNSACDPLCLDECWGPGPDMCVECRNFKVDGRCHGTSQDRR